MVVDPVQERAQSLSKEVGCDYGADWTSLITRPDIDAVVVSTTHNLLASISLAAIESGKHVFVEKPMGRSPAEVQPIADRFSSKSVGALKLVVGYTLRHYSHIRRAKELAESGAIGQLYYIRACYGHGGRPGYDQEWRMDTELGGGGELLDQGVHLIDLSRWFLGNLCDVNGITGRYFWTGTAHSDPVVKSSFFSKCGQAEDNAFMSMRNAIGQAAFLHASWTQWKNRFEFEIFGRDGCLELSGLSGYYGHPRLTLLRRRSQGGVPEIEEIACEARDVWADEWAAFVEAIAPSGASECSAESANATDGLEALRVVQRIYKGEEESGAHRVLPTGQLS